MEHAKAQVENRIPCGFVLKIQHGPVKHMVREFNEDCFKATTIADISVHSFCWWDNMDYFAFKT